MKTRPTLSTISLSVAAAIGLVQPSLSPVRAAEPRIRIASESFESDKAEKLTGAEVRGAKGEKIGAVADFVVDTRSGKIVLVAVSSGGFWGIGEKLRLAPFRALNLAADHERFTTVVAQSDWSKLPDISKSDFRAGKLSLAVTRASKIADAWYGHLEADRSADATPGVTPTGRGTDESDLSRRFVRAGDIRGREVRTGNEPVGVVDDLVIDFDHGVARALLDARAELATSTVKFVVPLSELEFRAGQPEPITTTLTRRDFQQAQQ